MSTNKKKKTANTYEAGSMVFKDLKISPSLGQLIRALRECDEVSQIYLAEKLGVSRQFLSDVEHDRRVVGVEFTKKLSVAMDYPIETFLQPLIEAQLKRAGIKCQVEIVPKAS